MKTITFETTPDFDESRLFERALKKSGMRACDVSGWRLNKRSTDARNKNDVKLCYSVVLYEGDEPENHVYETARGSVIVVGAGPAGLTSALYLARSGVEVTIIERGESVENRSKTVNRFFGGGALDTECNVQFGEGGAGTFSDGKLNTQVSAPEIKFVLDDLVSFGAPEDILYLSKPHIGSDRLPVVVKNMREEIIRLGGRVRFCERVTELITENGVVNGVRTTKGEYRADAVVLAIGHSSRDTFSYLYSHGVAMEGKDFAVGFRVEQLQEAIDKDRFGRFYLNKKLTPADYKLVSHASDRAVFTFCMCPGGEVVPSASEEGRLVVNGMSDYARSGRNANSAVVCQVYKGELGGGVLDGVEFQRKIERLAYEAAGGYVAPVQLAEDFVADRPSVSLKGVLPTYRRGFEFFELKKLLPAPMTESLRAGLNDMDKKIVGFASQGAVLTGVESRTSSPVRIVRGEGFVSLTHKNLYPCGEGCGYAGGIMSACVDGVKVARAIVSYLIKKGEK